MEDSTPIIDVTPHPAGFVPADDIWAFLRRRKGSIAFFWLLGVIAGIWWLLSRPLVYQAESRVMILRTGAGGPVSESELASEIELVRDPNHVTQTAQKQLAASTDTGTELLEQRIEQGLSVAPAGKSNLLAIQYRDTDPTTAARVVNQIVEYYLAERRYIFQTAGQPAGPQSAGTSGAVSAADLLSAFDAVNHGSELRQELDSRVQRRIDLEGRISELKAQIRDNQETSANLRKKLASLPDRIHSRTRTTSAPNAANRQVEETQILNPTKQQIESDLLRADGALAGLRARLDETQNVFRDARQAEDRASALLAEREKLMRKAQEAQGRVDSTGRETASANDRPNLRATLVNRAEPPTSPLPRYSWVWIPVAFLVALILALLIGWLIDQFDKPIYTPDDFERASGVPPPGGDHFAHGAGA